MKHESFASFDDDEHNSSCSGSSGDEEPDSIAHTTTTTTARLKNGNRHNSADDTTHTIRDLDDQQQKQHGFRYKTIAIAVLAVSLLTVIYLDQHGHLRSGRRLFRRQLPSLRWLVSAHPTPLHSFVPNTNIVILLGLALLLCSVPIMMYKLQPTNADRVRMTRVGKRDNDGCCGGDFPAQPNFFR